MICLIDLHRLWTLPFARFFAAPKFPFVIMIYFFSQQLCKMKKKSQKTEGKQMKSHFNFSSVKRCGLVVSRALGQRYSTKDSIHLPIVESFGTQNKKTVHQHRVKHTCEKLLVAWGKETQIALKLFILYTFDPLIIKCIILPHELMTKQILLTLLSI